jgi:uncharacterized DUF497 family protein
MALEFEWDAAKAASNQRKHGVTFKEASTVFGDPLGRLEADPRHSVREERLVLVGNSRLGRLLAVMFTERAGVIRVISARRATSHERTDYEESQR